MDLNIFMEVEAWRLTQIGIRHLKTLEQSEMGQPMIQRHFKMRSTALTGILGKVILDGIKSYAIANTVYIPLNVSIEGNGASITPKSGGTFVDGFMFFVNANSSKQTITPWGGELISKIKNLYMRNTNNLVNIKGSYIPSKYIQFFQRLIKAF